MCSITSLAQYVFFTSLKKTYPGYIPFFGIISVWNPAPSITLSGWFFEPSDAWRNFKPEPTKALGHKLIILERDDATLI